MTSPAQRLAALSKTVGEKNRFKNWLELLLVCFALAMILSLEVRNESASGMVVLNHDMKAGTVLAKDDVRIAAVSPLDQSLRKVGDAAGLTLTKALPAGAPLRWTNVQRLQVTALKQIAASDVVSDTNAARKLTSYDGLALTSLPPGKKAAQLIAEGAVLHATMLRDTERSKPAAPPQVYAPSKGEVELSLRFAGRTRATPPETVRLLIPRKGAAPLQLQARLLAVDNANSNIVVAIPLEAASAVVQDMPTEVYVLRLGP